MLTLLMVFENYDEIILVELPNIGYGRYVDEYPTPDAITDSVMKYVSQHHTDVMKSNSNTELGTIDLARHSYGTLVITYLMQRKRFVDLVNVNKIVLIAPICFAQSVFKIGRVSMLGMHNYIGFEREMDIRIFEGCLLII
jgi:hypothetical protein